jgi:hypothetical protein
MHRLALMLEPIYGGWVVTLTDGREIARFRGPGANWRARRFLARIAATGEFSGR